jgi:hypothetical protein
MSEVKTSSVGAEGGHWYTSDHELVVSVPRAKGDGMRKATLKDARRNGWRPGCTTVIRQAAAPQLEMWKQRQAIEATLDLDQQPEEETKAYMRRVIHRAGEIASEAARAGTEIHKQIELFFRGQKCDPFYKPHVLGVADLLERECATGDDLDEFMPERTVVHPDGYGCTVDLASSKFVLDFKTKKGTPEDWGDRTYPQHWMQLAACRAAISRRCGWPGDQACGIVYVSRDNPGECSLSWATEDQIQQGWLMFRALLAYWKAANRYDPTALIA